MHLRRVPTLLHLTQNVVSSRGRLLTLFVDGLALRLDFRGSNLKKVLSTDVNCFSEYPRASAEKLGSLDTQARIGDVFVWDV